MSINVLQTQIVCNSNQTKQKEQVINGLIRGNPNLHIYVFGTSISGAQ